MSKMVPYNWQANVFHTLSGKKHGTPPVRKGALLIPRQHGKTEYMIEELISLIETFPQHNPVGILCSASAKQAFYILSTRLFTRLKEEYPDWEFKKSEDRGTLTRRNGDVFTLYVKSGNNPGAIEGGALAYFLGDEVQYFKKGSLTRSILPAFTHTNGIVRLIGTFAEIDDELSKYVKAWSIMKEKQPKDYYAVAFDATDLEDVKGKEWLENKKTEAMLANDIDAFNKAYMCKSSLTKFSHKEDIFKEDIVLAKEQGRVGNFPFHPEYAVNVAFDIGRKNTAIVFYQNINGQRRYINSMIGGEKTPGEWARELMKLPYRYDVIKLPHDAYLPGHDGRSWKQMFSQSFRGGEIVKIRKPNKKEDNHVVARQALNLCVFDNNLEALNIVQALESRRWALDSNRMLTNQLAKNPLNHLSDAFIYTTCSGHKDHENYLENRKKTKTKPRTFQRGFKYFN